MKQFNEAEKDFIALALCNEIKKMYKFYKENFELDNEFYSQRIKKVYYELLPILKEFGEDFYEYMKKEVEKEMECI